jgi:hypothetical protein
MHIAAMITVLCLIGFAEYTKFMAAMLHGGGFDVTMSIQLAIERKIKGGLISQAINSRVAEIRT